MRNLLKPLVFFLMLLAVEACVDRLTFKVDDLNLSQLVVDGLITDEPGPYTVRLFRSSDIDDNLRGALPFSVKAVALLDNTGTIEQLVEKDPGVYETSPTGMQGIVGRAYTLRIEARDGTIYESTPEEMYPVPPVDSVYYQFESFVPLNGPTQYGFRIFMDAKSNGDDKSFLRWKFTGAYEVEAFPSLNHLLCNCCERMGPPDPLPCSGVVFTGTFLKKIGDCQCCNAWVSDYESKPQLNDDQIETNGEFKKVEVGYVPFTAWTFGHNKYMVKVEQMSLSREVYEFWKIIKDQKEGTSSLFQPAFGKVKTNISSSNPDRIVTGIFYAASVKKKIRFLTGTDASIPVPSYDIAPPESNCALWVSPLQVFDNASLTPPKDWN